MPRTRKFRQVHPLFRYMYWMFSDELTRELTDRDFANYWIAGRMVVDGDPSQLFSQTTYLAHLRDLFGADYPVRNWGYPPHSLLLLWPLGLLEYKSALTLFLGTTFVFFAASVVVFRRMYAPDSSLAVLVGTLLAYTVVMIGTVQNGFLTAGLLLLGLAWMQRRPASAGCAFALLTIKPQLGFLLPLLLVLDRNWVAIGYTFLWMILLLSASIAFFGPDIWHAYLTETLKYQRSVMTDGSGVFLFMMPTVFGSARVIDLSSDAALMVQWPVSACSAAFTYWILLKDKDPLRRCFVLGCATFLVSPYAFNYDMGALAAIAAMFAAQELSSRTHVVAVSVIAGLPAGVMNLGRSHVPIAPLLLAAGLIVVWLEARCSAAGLPSQMGTTAI